MCEGDEAFHNERKNIYLQIFVTGMHFPNDPMID